MAKYDVKFKCGHTEIVNLKGATSEREEKINYYENFGKCSKCRKDEFMKKVIQLNEESMKESKELCLTELAGSKKQIEWATTIRLQLIRAYHHFLEKDDASFIRVGYKDYEKLFKMLLNKNESSFFIEHRDCGILTVFDALRTEIENIEKEQETKIDKEYQEKAAQAKMDVVKEAGIFINDTEDYAEIKKDGNVIKVYYKYDEVFIAIVKSLNFNWENPWQFEVSSEIYGDIEDRIVELGVKLIDNNINIFIDDDNLKNKILSKDYKKRDLKWLTLTKGKKLILKNYESNNNLYNCYKDKKIFGKWNNGGIIVNVENYTAILTFCDENNFKITKKAYDFIKGYAGEENMKTMKELKENLCDD